MTHKPRLLVHTSRIPIRWGDMDALGHVNNTVYFRFMEQARIEWVNALIGAPLALRAVPPRGSNARSGRPVARMPVAGGAHMLPIVIVNASCTFLRPLVYPGEVEVRLLLGDPGRTSVGSYYELLCAGELYAEGAAKIVWIEPGTGRPAPLPAFVPEQLREAAAGAAAHR